MVNADHLQILPQRMPISLKMISSMFKFNSIIFYEGVLTQEHVYVFMCRLICKCMHILYIDMFCLYNLQMKIKQ